MSSSFEKSVKGGTKIKLAPPKAKYVEHILLATHSGEAGVAEVFRTLTHRLRDSTWTIVFKSLIIVHLMIKEGEQDVTLSYLSVSPKHRLAINSFTDVQTQGQNIRLYSKYILQRATSFAQTRVDYVRSGEGRMKNLTVDKGLLRETEAVQDQIKVLVKCDLLSNDVEDEISVMAYRMLTKDLLVMFNVVNEAVMNVLSHFFEMSRPDAERAINIYRTFAKQTDQVVQFLGTARTYEFATKLEVPKVKHAPTGLATSLQDYLDDKDFEVNRRQYLAQQEAKKTGRPFDSKAKATSSSQPKPAEAPKSASQPVPASQPAKGPAPDLIDFFDSIEQNQQPMVQNNAQFQHPQQNGFGTQPFQQIAPQQYQQQTGFAAGQSSTNPFVHQQQSLPQQITQQQQQPPQQLQPQFTGAGFGGYGPQPQQSFVGEQLFTSEPQQQFVSSPVESQSQPQAFGQIQPQSTNPFRQSTMPTGAGSIGAGSVGTLSSISENQPQRQSTNPFARNTPQQTGGPQMPQQDQQTQQFSPQQQSPAPLQPMMTGTNPFARNITPQQQQSPPPAAMLQPNPTGSTNPFRQSAFVNQQTGQGWQSAPQQATLGGMNTGNIDTMPIFPRPGQSQPQQQQQQSPWG